MRIKYFSAALALSLAPVFAWAADAPAQLQQFVSTVQSATGQFTQQTETAGQGRAKAPQHGDFSFQRPGKFKWHVKQPYEQLVVSDGTRVLQYDPDLAQVTERGIDQSIGTSPAAILFGSGSLDDAFQVTARPDSERLQWLRAVPRSSDAGFKHVDIGFRNNLPVRLLLLDAFGQTTRIDLSNIQANPGLPPNAFQFTPPAGVDTVKMQ